ncbi:hypothetical protein DEJ21_08015 [Curtobacterium sp. MCSS17_006]|uniref:DUF6119 family protein n=1 Tax=Curtobacterium sp. MCSS17_006 TaxID=2175642 RepID=UPI000DA88C3A|nr:DUF6119 family protein [Curtobacterium sp. MCSS17_006]PZE36819.1 hypothetical protein DEJ21_08015 [Curtobacterium sp. MCSS17_006]
MRLTMYLMREGVTADAAVLRESADYEEAALRAGSGGVPAVFLFKGDSKAPGWLGEVAKLTSPASPDSELVSRSLGAVVLVAAGERVVAVTFGSGYHALESSVIERGFGLRVTANMVATNGIRGAQTRGVARSSRDQKTLLPGAGRLQDLAVEVDEDWLRQLSGKSKDGNFALNVSGADSLTITVKDFDVRALAEKVKDVMSAWAGIEYKASFPFLDRMVPLDRSDPLIPDLDALAASQVRGKNSSLSFAAPDPFEQLAVDHYEIACQYQRYILSDLDAAVVLDIAAKLDEKKSPLESVRVRALNEDGEDIDRAYGLKSYLQTEVNHHGVSYLLSAGHWFSLQADFVAEIEAAMAEVPDISEELELPEWDPEALRLDESDKTAEGSYNIGVSKSRGYALLDKRLVTFGAYKRLEICDLLTPDAELLCVKAASDSPALSHLVAQVMNSADAWGDKQYDEKLAAAWAGISESPLFDRRKARFVLAIATAKPGALADNLFFFSMVQIVNGFRKLSRGQFGFAVAKIPMTAVEPVKVERGSQAVKFQ